MDDDSHDRIDIDQWETGSSQELFSLSPLEISVRTLWHISELNMLYADSFEFFDFMTASLDHSSNLAVFTFCEDYGKSIRAHSLHFAGEGLDKFPYLLFEGGVTTEE